MSDENILINQPPNPTPTPVVVAPIVKPLSTFAQVALCKENTKDLINNLPDFNHNPETNIIFENVSKKQNECLTLISKLNDENSKTQNPKELLKSLQFSYSRIQIEQKILASLKKDTFEAKEIDNLGSLKYGLTLVRQQESVAWNEYKSYLENQKNGTTNHLIENIGIFILLALLFGVIMAIGKRMNITK